MNEIIMELKELNSGYDGRCIVGDVNLKVRSGEILTLIGPNGAGKSTLLKTITGSLNKISGSICIDMTELKDMSAIKLAQSMSVVLTDRINPELMTVRDIVSMGRYPYTGFFGKLSPDDEHKIDEALLMVDADKLSDMEFATLSDGQKQRIMLARAICQEPQVMVLDEPTSFLDIRYKLDVLRILKKLVKEMNMAVVMSLHEVELALKISDYIACVKDNRIVSYGRPDEVSEKHNIMGLYDLSENDYDFLFTT